MSQPVISKSIRQPQMDGLRAFAMILVLLHHFGGHYLNSMNLGTIGVRFFFVVSGFLITRILLKSRAKFENGASTWRHELGNFQMRRLIRTLPVYYLALLVAAAIGIPPVRKTLGWTLTFLTNFYMAHIGYYPAAISHFWTLAVQEQFYLFWPFMIFFLPKLWIKYSFPTLIAISLVFRIWCIQTGASDIVRWFNLLNNLDTFAAGGILAYVSLTNPLLIVKRATRVWSGVLAVLSMCVSHQLRLLPPDSPWSIWIELFEVAFMTWLVACSVSGFRGWFGSLLSWQPLTYLGKISYGIYVYHVFVAILLQPFFQRMGQTGTHSTSILLTFFIKSGVSIAIASLSWHFFEQPMLKARENIARWFSPKAA